ncbi:MAG: head decoration protein [Xanthomonadaceae bacterium]|nr:head decoration protein [Xanthomonadaceae bacterium]
MASFAQPKKLSQLLLVSVAAGWTTERGAFAAGDAIGFGTVLAKVGNNYVPLDPAGVDGSEIAVGVLAEDMPVRAATAIGTVIARGAVLEETELVWPIMTAPQTAAALASLDARGIVVRASL